MREILFRGKRIYNGEWVEGYLRRTTLFNASEAPPHWRMAFVIEPPFEEPFTCEWAEVDPATVGQYTGLTDKNGKRTDNGEWVEGWYVPPIETDWHKFGTAISYICESGYLEDVTVDPATVGQYTGLNDKNGKRIFEGDIFHIEDEILGVVIFKDGGFRMEEYGLCGTWTESGFDEYGGGWGIIECEPIDWYTIGDMEVIGNIHDNPELMKEG